MSVAAAPPPPLYRRLIYDLVLAFLTRIFHGFFREIRTRGAFRIPATGPVIFVAAPHANQFVDPGILMGQVQLTLSRRVSFLVAASSYKRFFIWLFSWCQMAIPVLRAQDNLKAGSGKISVDLLLPLTVRGSGTRFTTECTAKGLLALPRSLGVAEIETVVSDTEITLRREFKRNNPEVERLLTRGTNFKAADKVNQRQVYERVFSHLSGNQCLGIFPEGGSHDRTDLLPLKAGVAIMALGAMENDPNCHVRIIPCGMNYFKPHKFRLRAVVEFGHPIEISPDLVARYTNPEQNRAAVKELLDTITQGLRAVTVTCDDYDTLTAVQTARRLYAGNFTQRIPLPLVIEFNRRLVVGYNHYRDDPLVQRLRARITAYHEHLVALRLADHQVETLADDYRQRLAMVPVLVSRVVKMVVLGALALPGGVLFSPVFIVAKKMSRKKAAEALAALTVKIAANDVLATWKILIAMGVAPIVYVFWAVVGLTLARHYDYWLWLLKRTLFVLLYLGGVLVTYAALIIGDQGMDLFKSLRPLWLLLTTRLGLDALKRERTELAADITSVVNELGPDLFPDFNLLKYSVNDEAEEERKTSSLRKRRERRKKEKAEKVGMERTPSFSDSDGISRINSANDLLDVPMFSNHYRGGSDADFQAWTSGTSDSEAEEAGALNLKIREAVRKERE